MLVVWAGLARGVLLVGVPAVGAAVALGAAGDDPVAAAEPLDPELGRAPEAIAVAPVPVPPRPEPARPEPAATDPAATDPTDPVALAFGVPLDFGPALGVPALGVPVGVPAPGVAALGVPALGVATLGVAALGALGANRSGAGRDRDGAAAVVLTAGAKGQGCWGITDSGGTEGLRGLVPDRDPDPVPVPPLPPLPPRSPEPMTL